MIVREQKHLQNRINRRFLTNRKGHRRLLSIGVSALLSISTFLAVLPQTQKDVYADDAKKSIMVGSEGAKKVLTPVLTETTDYYPPPPAGPGDQTRNRVSTAQTVYYGSKDGEHGWLAIGCDGIGAIAEEDSRGSLTLFAKGPVNDGDDRILFSVDSTWPEYGQAGGTRNQYGSSNLRYDRNLGVEAVYDKIFTVAEKDAFKPRTLASGSYAEFNTDVVAGGSVDVKLWPLSTKEADIIKSEYREFKYDWWLRSPGNAEKLAAMVNNGGGIWVVGVSSDYDDQQPYTASVRPAFNLDLSSIILTSAASGGKNPTTAGTLETPGNYTGTEWKLTLHDNKMNTGIGTAGISRSGSTITVPYTVSGDNAGNVNRISVLITDKAYTASGAVIKYYGKLAMTGSIGTSGSGTFTLPTDYNTSWKVYILSEQINADKKSDYASTPLEITIPAESSVPVTGVTVSPKEVELKPGSTKLLTATVKPNDATNRKVKWSSNKESVAKVDEDEGLVTAIAEGEAIITAKTVDGGKTDTCKVIVKKDAPVVEECRITFDPNGGKGEMDPQTGNKGETIKLKANDFIRRGYVFKNWNTKADGSGDKYDNKESIKLEKDLTLYAQWKEKREDDDDDDDHEEEPAPKNDERYPDGFDELRGLLNNAASAAKTTGLVQTVTWNKSTSLPADVMKILHDNPNVTLVFSYTYLGAPITLTIPGSAVVLNPAVEWYGPAYLYALYGKGTTAALTTNTTVSTRTYTVKSGDTLSGIAKRLKTTVKHLQEANNIKDADKIKPGMVLKY